MSADYKSWLDALPIMHEPITIGVYDLAKGQLLAATRSEHADALFRVKNGSVSVLPMFSIDGYFYAAFRMIKSQVIVPQPETLDMIVGLYGQLVLMAVSLEALEKRTYDERQLRVLGASIEGCSATSRQEQCDS